MRGEPDGDNQHGALEDIRCPVRRARYQEAHVAGTQEEHRGDSSPGVEATVTELRRAEKGSSICRYKERVSDIRGPGPEDSSLRDARDARDQATEHQAESL